MLISTCLSKRTTVRNFKSVRWTWKEKLLVAFDRTTTERVLTYCVTSWLVSCAAADGKTLRCVISASRENQQLLSALCGRRLLLPVPLQSREHPERLLPLRPYFIHFPALRMAFQKREMQNKSTRKQLLSLGNENFELPLLIGCFNIVSHCNNPVCLCFSCVFILFCCTAVIWYLCLCIFHLHS